MKLEELPPRSRVYISGGITNVPDYGTVFEKAEKLINSIPHLYAESPTNIEPHPSSFHPYGKYMRSSVKRMMDCDAVYMLTGWENSLGARTEHTLAAICGMPIVYEER